MPTFQELIAGIKTSPTATMLALSFLLICGLFGWIRSEDAAKTTALEKAQTERDVAQKQIALLIQTCADNTVKIVIRHKAETDSIYRVFYADKTATLQTVLNMKKEIKYLKSR